MLVCGSTVAVIEFHYYRGDFSKDLLTLLAIIGMGTLLICLAFLCESPGRFQRAFVITRNSCIAVIVIAVAFLLLITALGPLH